MVSIEVGGGHHRAPHDALRDAVDWGRVVVATLARGLVATLLGLALWAAAPAVIGWQPTTVMTGSMEPRLVPGDVVVSRPTTASEARVGQVLLADDPDQAGHLRMHRFVERGAGGTLVTKGDANPQRDSTPLEASAVHGVGFLRIPLVGSPIVWLRDGEWHKLVLLTLGVAALLALCTVDGSLRRLTGGTDDDAGPDGTDDGREARDGADPSLPSGAPSRRALQRRARRARRARGVGGAAVVALVAGGLGVLLPAEAVAAPFSRTTGSQTAFAAAVPAAPGGLKCTQTTSNTVTISWTPGTSDLPFGYAVLADGTQVTTAGPTATSAVVSGQGLLNLGTNYKVTVRADFGSTGWNTATTSSSFVSVRVTSVLGIASATCA